MIVEGNISVKAVLESNKRVVKRLLIQDGKRSKDINYLLFLAHQKEIAIEFVSKELIDSLSVGHSHGGVLLECEQRRYDNLELQESDDFVLLLEGIEDPYNLGSILRTAYLAGVTMVFLPRREYGTMETTILKSSAGYSERLSLVLLDNDRQQLETLKIKGFKIFSALRSDRSQSLYQMDFKQKVCLCIGGEKRGLSKEVIDLSDQFVVIEYPHQARNALSSIASANILCFEVVRQRMDRYSHEN